VSEGLFFFFGVHTPEPKAMRRRCLKVMVLKVCLLNTVSPELVNVNLGNLFHERGPTLLLRELDRGRSTRRPDCRLGPGSFCFDRYRVSLSEVSGPL